jgi:hypothetical protein
MAEFRFTLYRTEIRQAEVSVQAHTFEAAAVLAARIYLSDRGKINCPSKATMRTRFEDDEKANVMLEVVSGREVR